MGEVAVLANTSIEMLFSKGSLIVINSRLAYHFLSRLRSPSDGDVLCPAGTVSILGPTSIRLDSPYGIQPTVDEVDHIISEGLPMVPSVKNCRYIRAYSGVRPLITKKKPRIRMTIEGPAEDLISSIILKMVSKTF